MKKENEERTKLFEEKKSQIPEDENNGEYQGNPVFDNDEGYYRITVGDHIAYRFEVLKILGKGSFAQVVMCKDHKDPSKPTYAVKVTRNTEMDHKYAHKEGQYLKFIL